MMSSTFASALARRFSLGRSSSLSRVAAAAAQGLPNTHTHTHTQPPSSSPPPAAATVATSTTTLTLSSRSASTFCFLNGGIPSAPANNSEGSSSGSSSSNNNNSNSNSNLCSDASADGPGGGGGGGPFFEIRVYDVDEAMERLHREQPQAPLGFIWWPHEKPSPLIDASRCIVSTPPLVEEEEEGPGANEGMQLIKRTYQPSVLRRKRAHGFLSRLKNRDGRKILQRRRLKSRTRLGV